MKKILSMTVRAATVAAAVLWSSPLLSAGPLDPLDFASLGTWSVSSGDYTIDTDDLTIVDDAAPGVPLFMGVMDDQDGQADSFGPGGAVTTVGSNGIPHIAVFTFDDLALDGTATFTVTGHRALALLSRGDAFIDVPLSLNGQYASISSNAIPGAGGAGGFSGGAPTLNGEGPGGGSGVLSGSFSAGYGGSGGFGGIGTPGFLGPPVFGEGGAAYGDLRQVLQGGGGGGGIRMTAFGDNNTVGGGGGGALELGAAGVLTVGGSCILQANGGFGQTKSIGLSATGGNGSGGGIRLHAARLIMNGAVEAQGTSGDAPHGGGGRVLRAGDVSLPVYTVGTPQAPSGYSTGVDVSSAQSHGWITAVPSATFVPGGTSFELGTITILQSNGFGQPGVELVTGDLIVDGTVTVPAGGITYQRSIALASANATITGSDQLVLGKGGKLSGGGSVEVDVVIGEEGNVITIDDFLKFTGSVSNQVGADITVVSGTLTVPGDGNGATDDGIVNLGTLNLVDAIVNGDVRSPAGSTVNVAGTATFNGHFKGAALFSGTQNLVVFNGGYSPGDSPAAVDFGGSLTLGTGNVLTMELGGPDAGSGYDQLTVGGELTVGGTLEVVYLPPYLSAGGQEFDLFDFAVRSDTFSTVNLPTLPAGRSWDTSRLYTEGILAVVGTTTFAAEHPGLTENGDENSNGVGNYVEYAQGFDPGAPPDPGLGLMLTGDLVLTFRQRSNAADVFSSWMTSTDLQHGAWIPMIAGLDYTLDSMLETGDQQTVELELLHPSTDDPFRFYRIEFATAPP